jgi:hypothetical protein
MRRTLLSLLAVSSLAMAIPAIANAQTWQSMNQRQYAFSQRIDAGLRSGALTQQEAGQLRAEFDTIARLENEYRRSPPGLTQAELQDLDRRFDMLSDRLNRETADNDRYGNGRGGRDGDRYDDNRYGNGRGNDYVNIAERRDNLARRIDQGVRNGQLNQREAARMRREYDAIVQLEAQYRASDNRLSRSEIAELDRRYDALAQDVRRERSDDERDRDRDGARDREWDNAQQMRADLERRIATAQTRGRIGSVEAGRLRTDVGVVVRLEAQYRASAPGLTRAEVDDLNRRIDMVERRIGDNIDFSLSSGYRGPRYDR